MIINFSNLATLGQSVKYRRSVSTDNQILMADADHATDDARNDLLRKYNNDKIQMRQTATVTNYNCDKMPK